MKLRQFDIGILLFLGIILGLSAFFYASNMGHPPEFHHAWSMSDYYAMALRFNAEHLNIFLPQTYNLMTPNGVTSSDFPLPAWLCAVLMRITGLTTPTLFRMLSWLVSTVAFVMFYKALKKPFGANASISTVRAISLSMLIWLLPTFIYFNNAFIPSTWAFSAFLITFWAYQHQKTALAIGALTLAALLRKPYILWLFAFSLFLWQQKALKTNVRVLLSGWIIFMAWQAYDLYLGQHYGQLFLRSFRPPESFQEAWEGVMGIFSKWGWIWFSPWHLIGLGLLIFMGLRNRQYTSIWFPVAALGVAFIYFMAMQRQFWDHDYYVLDSFYPALVCWIWWGQANTSTLKWMVWVESALVIAAFFWAIPIQHFYQDPKRFETTEKTNRAFAAAKPMFDAVDPGGKAKVLVFEAYSFNFPLLDIRRAGYCLLSSNPAVQQTALDRGPDLVACLDTFFVSEVVNDNPGIVEQLQFLKSDGTVLLFKPAPMPGQRLESMFGLPWNVLSDTTLEPTSDEYLLTQQRALHGPQKILFYGKMGLEPAGSLKATVAAFKGDKVVYYAEKQMTTKEAKTLQFRSISIDLPILDADYVKIYLWNPDKRTVQLVGFRVAVVGG
jgi:hypothetical protein